MSLRVTAIITSQNAPAETLRRHAFEQVAVPNVDVVDPLVQRGGVEVSLEDNDIGQFRHCFPSTSTQALARRRALRTKGLRWHRVEPLRRDLFSTFRAGSKRPCFDPIQGGLDLIVD